MTLSGAKTKTPTIIGTLKPVSPFTEDNDTYSNSTSNTVLNALGGNDSIKNSATKVTIYGGNGNDTVINSASGVKVYGDAGADKISIGGSSTKNVTIYGGSENDTLYSNGKGNVFVYNKGDGYDIIYGIANADTISISGATRSTVGSNLVLSITGGGAMTLSGAKTKTPTIIGTAEFKFTEGNDSYSNSASSTLLNALGGDDRIINNANSVTIIGGTGDDIVSLTSSSKNSVIQYASGDGYDVVYGYNATTTISITDGHYETLTAGKNVFVKIDGEEAIELSGAKGKQINIIGDSVPPHPTLPSGWSINSAGDILTATVAAPDEIDLNEDYGADIETVNATKATSYVKIIGNDHSNLIIGGKGNDELDGYGESNDTLTGGKGDDVFIYSGGDDVITDYSDSGVWGSDYIQFDTDAFTITAVETVNTNGDVMYTFNNTEGTVLVQGGANKEITFIDSHGNIIPVDDTLPSGWRYNATKTSIMASVNSGAHDLDLTQSYGENIHEVDASIVSSGVIVVAHDNGVCFKGGKGADCIVGGAGNDTVSLGAGNDVFVYSGGGDDVIKDYAVGDTIKLGADITFNADATQIKGNDVIFTFNQGESNAGKLTIKCTGRNYARNLNKNGQIIIVDENDDQIYPEPNILPEGWDYNTSKNMITVTGATPPETELDLREPYGEDVTKVDATGANINLQITCNDLGVSVLGGTRNDTITSGAGDDKISLGAGNDVFVYTEGDDIVQDYTAGEDSIQVDDNGQIEIQAYEIVDEDRVLTTDQGTITIKNAKNETVTFINRYGDLIDMSGFTGDVVIPTGWFLNSAGTLIKATSTAPEEIDLTQSYGTKISTVDASKATAGVEIIGNSNSLISNSIKGGKSNDTIIGGEGSDIVSLGGGSDIYVYTGGSDTIQDYAAGQDSIVFGNDIIANPQVSISGSNLIYKTDVGNLTIKNGASKSITTLKAADCDINYYASSYDLIGDSDLFADDNFMESGAQISNVIEITPDDYSVTNLSAIKYENFAQDECKWSITSGQ